ncbi:YphA family membrane protein [Effusibacillus dendaii]|uniref:Uncharacterized protein n=1 Tax=Effusibacillus dendaii TaxID=2743772 RepID=A0A7I8D966_9BACL|nr:hypothetical protein [Effusibacillus dendaii]BCJ85366.1 hypothetical protein skT53_03510 [Effusibacillus dendaii]
MRPDVFALITFWVAAVMFATGWGNRYVESSGLKNGQFAAVLLLIGTAGDFNLEKANLVFNLGAVIVGALIGIFFGSIRSWKQQIQFLLAIVTVAAVDLVFMVLVPQDPAFYLFDEQVVYPLAAVMSAYLFSRKPLFCMNAALFGILMAGVIQHNRFQTETGTFLFGDSDIMELLASTMIISFVTDQLVHMVNLLFYRLWRRHETAEGDPT